VGAPPALLRGGGGLVGPNKANERRETETEKENRAGEEMGGWRGFRQNEQEAMYRWGCASATVVRVGRLPATGCRRLLGERATQGRGMQSMCVSGVV